MAQKSNTTNRDDEHEEGDADFDLKPNAKLPKDDDDDALPIDPLDPLLDEDDEIPLVPPLDDDADDEEPDFDGDEYDEI